MSVIESMRGFHRSGRQTQPRLCAKCRFAQAGYARMFSSNRRQQSVAAVLPLQLVHQVLEMGGQFGSFGAKVLLQPFADGTANRSAGSAIDLFAALVDPVGHRGFRFAFVAGD
jgi:hypothetical protein